MMRDALSETLWLYSKLLDEEQKIAITNTLVNIEEENNDYSLSEYWKMDEAIGGIGGYCLPKNAVHNPFPYGIKRSLFRPLQYAASEMDIRDIRNTSRYVVLYSGMHLEASLRFFLMINTTFGKIRYYNSTLGKIVRRVEQLHVFDEQIIAGYYNFIQLYNKSKHEINQFKNRHRLFAPADALVSYTSARILGNEVLKMIEPGAFHSNIEI
jgi:hypothetical protein